jgi:L-seryl-tRNA(Ser) seleniumtransferase
MDLAKQEALKRIPKIDEVLLILRSRNVFDRVSKDIVLQVCRETVEEIRRDILESGGSAPSGPQTADRVELKIGALRSGHLRPVVNATGVILHTNLGRAILCEEALQNLLALGRSYSNLEFDLETGKRGSRYDHLRGILCELTGAEDAMVVNNNAAAVLLAVNTLAEDREVIVSRGELIEIGGEFRLPDVMEKSKAVLREVGTTNKTHEADYEKAISEKTGLLFKAHTSNYKIIGFTGEVGVAEFAELGHRHGIPVMHDLGSGCFIRLDQYGMEREPTVQETVAAGIDIVSFSGDKLLGGPQAGIIVGRRNWIRKISQNPLNRALRIDKFTIAALEATLSVYLEGEEKAAARIPALRALTEPVAQIEKRARKLLRLVTRPEIEGLTLALKRDYSMAGGGSLPGRQIPSVLVGLRSDRISAGRFESSLRRLDPPIIARITEDEVLFDLRTVLDEELPVIANGIRRIAGT